MTAVVILLLVALQRLAELRLARSNTERLLAEGGREVGAWQYPFIVALHVAWLLGLLELAPGHSAHWGWLSLFILLQVLRLWVIATLGRRWTTRIIVLPGAPLVRGGPFEFVAHPNYAIVAAEIAVLPLAFGLVGYALLFTVLNGLILAIRITAEDAALRDAQGEPKPPAEPAA
jgi:methyltransferase